MIIGGSSVCCCEYVTAVLLNPDEFGEFAVLVVLLGCAETLVVDADVGCTENYTDGRQRV